MPELYTYMYVCIKTIWCYNRPGMNESFSDTSTADFDGRSAASEYPLNKHQQKTEETRRALLEAARQIFARDGFEACRIEDIAAAAGHTRGAFYANFKAKEELFFALLYEEVEKHARQVRAMLRRCANMDERVSAMREYYVNYLADRTWGMLMLEFKLFAVRHPRLRPKLAATHRRIRASLKLEDLQEMLGLGTQNFEPTRAALEAVLTGFFLQHAYDPRLLSKHQAARLLSSLFDFLVRPEQAKAR
jgi:AcrR family transcriptional regulator